ncbi:MAG: zf-TFIIB domain-containing protein [Pseudomonadota bacterium]
MTLDCPKCTGTLQVTTYGDDISAHRCDSCAGLWCQPETLIKMRREWMSEAALDTGDPRIGQRLNKVDDIECPVGHGLMRNSRDAEQTHIRYEECETCGGIFLDAGEFTDLKYNTLMDKVRGLLAARR